MKKIFILTTLLILLIVFGCDRFEHKFEPSLTNIGLDEFADSMEDLFANTNQFNYQEINSTFSDNYFNSGTVKDDMIDYFGDFFLIDPNTTFFVDSVEISSSYNINWHFKAIDSSREIIADTTFFDYLINENNGYVFYGNQNNKRKIVVELFTGQWCSNCPNAEDALHHLREKYSSRFSYVEYHVGDQLQGDVSNLLAYYPFMGGLPMGIVNGNALLLYEAPDPATVQAAIDTAIEPLLQADPLITFSGAETDVINNTLSGNVLVNKDASLENDNLKLVAVLMENYNDEYVNYHGEAHHNITLKRIDIDLTGLDLTEPVAFEISNLDMLPAFYTELPDDLTLVLWVQKLETPYNEDSCQVYNIIEVPIN